MKWTVKVVTVIWINYKIGNADSFQRPKELENLIMPVFIAVAHPHLD